MKTLITTLITFLTLISSASASQCQTLAGPAMNAFQPALATFMEDKMDVLPGDITEVKELEYKMRNTLLSGATFSAIAAITSPIWLPFYISDRINHPHAICPISKNVFKANFLVTYNTPEGKTCKLEVKYKAKGQFLSQFRTEDRVTKTIIKTKFAPECE